MDSHRYNENRLTDTVGDAADKIADKWRKLSPRTKKIIAGGTAAATVGGGVLGGLIGTGHEEQISPEQVQSGQLNYQSDQQPMLDGQGRMALMNYFDADTPPEQQVLRVSLASVLPESFRNGHQQGDYLDTVRNTAQSHTWRTEVYYVTECHGSGEDQHCHQEMRTRQVKDNHYYSYNLNIEQDFMPANAEQERQVREYFREFERLTGIKVEVTRDAPDAHITIANYRNEPNYYRGTLDDVDPDVIATYPPGSSHKNAPSLQRNLIIMNDRNYGSNRGLMNQIGRPLGFENGKVDVAALREGLERLGFPVAPLRTQDDVYALDGNVSVSHLVADNIIIDNGGHNTLEGTDKSDTLVTEAGYCGRTGTPTNKFTNIFGDGKEYCIAEGEFALVRGGEGNDLILTARGGGQTIEPGAGEDRIALFQPEMGEVTVLASGEEGSNTLYLHDANVERGDVQVSGSGEDVVLQFSALSGRDVGRVTLPEQLNGGGIDRIVVVDDKGKTVFEKDVRELASVQEWQEELAEPMQKTVDAHSREKAKEMAARWQNTVRRRDENEQDGGISI